MCLYLKLLHSRLDVQEIFREVGEAWELSTDLFEKLCTFTCQLYMPNSDVKDINELRYRLFCCNKGEVESHQLPPCKDCLFKHAQRTNYQAAILKRSLMERSEIPSPVGHGWKVELCNGQEQLIIGWMEGNPAPTSVLELLACKCSKSCLPGKCPCVQYNMKS